MSHVPFARALGMAALLLACIPAHAQSGPPPNADRDHAAPFNYGFGNGVRVPQGQMTWWNRMAGLLGTTASSPYDTQRAIQTLSSASTDPPANGGPNAATQGIFGTSLPWPIIPLHMALLPDGRVMSYGTDQNGRQGASMYYDVWDPTQPYATSQTVLPNVTGTDIFCSGLGLLPNGTLLITGGDQTVNGARNYSNANATLFAPSSNTISANGTMAYPRWYPADVPLPNGDQLIVGGRSNQNPSVPVSVPEYYSAQANVFTPLSGASMSNKLTWYYTKVFVTSGGSILAIDTTGNLFSFGTGGIGTFASVPGRIDSGLYDTPTVMYRPGKLLSVRKPSYVGSSEEDYTFDAIDATGATPTSTRIASLPGMGREWSNMTVLADGTVFVNGGSGTDNKLSMVSYTSALYNPATGGWTMAATASQPRLYHSASLLLPDGTVLTGGGGAPGPVNELNAEIYYPPYLFLPDGSGNFAPRPAITAAPPAIAAGAVFDLTMADATPIGGVNLIRLGAVTHATSLQSRFVPASFTQNGTDLTITAPTNTNDLLSGYWMVFALSTTGVPSVAKILYVPPPNATNH